MNIIFSNQKSSNTFNFLKRDVSFCAGLTPAMIKDIQKSDTLEITNSLSEKGISSDFKENKVIAWSCKKAIEIFEYINKNFGQKLALPKGIFVEDFKDLRINGQTASGFCNTTPTKIRNNAEETVPAQTIFFNSFKTRKEQTSLKNKWLYDWNYINDIADFNYETKHSGTDFFLDPFFHEFAHVAHENVLLKKMGGKALLQNLKFMENEKIRNIYKQKYGQKVKEICNYALESPFEAVACDLSRTISQSLDKNTLLPQKNPFTGTAYENLSFWQEQKINHSGYSSTDRPLVEILRNFWNGKFE